MPKVYEPAELGQIKRAYDHFDDDTYPEEIIELLGWYRPVKANDKNQGKLDKAKIKVLLDQGFDLEQIAKYKVVKNLKAGSQKGFVLDKLVDIIEDIVYSVWDFVSWRKVKSSLTILGGIGMGALLGGIIGTFVLPGIGTAIGGTIGAGITTGLAAIGGVLGVTILGGFIGSFIGKKASDKLFKFEKRFQPSRRFTRVIKKKFDINTSTIDMMNGYLYNREKAVQSKAMKKYIKKLRKDTIHKAKSESMEQLGYFFLSELELLELESTRQPSNLQLRLEIDAVKHILKKMTYSKLSDDLKINIKVSLKDYEERQEKKKIVPEDHFPKVRKVVAREQKLDSALKDEQSFGSKIPVPSTSKTATESQPKKQTATESIEPITRSGSMLFSRTSSQTQTDEDLSTALGESIAHSLAARGYQIQSAPNTTAGHYHADYQSRMQDGKSPFTFSMDYETKADKMVTEIKSSKPESATLEEEIEEIVQQALLYRKETNDKKVTVLANGDHEFAAQLFAALKREEFSPMLDRNEYPESSPKRREVLKNAEKLIGKHMDRPTVSSYPHSSRS